MLSVEERQTMRSKRSKLNEFSPENLLVIVRRCFGRRRTANGCSVRLAALLRNAKLRNSAEAEFLFGALSRCGVPMDDPPPPDPPRSAQQLAQRLAAENETDPILAPLYAGLTLSECDRTGCVALLRTAAERGSVAAMSALGRRLQSRHATEEEAEMWLERAAEAGDPEAVFSRLDHSAKLKVIRPALEEGVRRGSVTCMEHLRSLLFFKRRRETPVSAALSARALLYGGEQDGTLSAIICAVEDVEKKNVGSEGLDLLYALGRELDGGDEIWEPRLLMPPQYTVACDVYLMISSAARRAALQAVAALRTLGIVRDVGVLVGKLVYASRVQPWLWYDATTKHGG